MARKKAGAVPQLQQHKGIGPGKVHLGGRDFYCGKWGTPTWWRLDHWLQGLTPWMLWAIRTGFRVAFGLSTERSAMTTVQITISDALARRPPPRACLIRARSKRSCARDLRQFVSERCRPPGRRWFQPLCRPWWPKRSKPRSRRIVRSGDVQPVLDTSRGFSGLIAVCGVPTQASSSSIASMSRGMSICTASHRTRWSIRS